MAKINFTKQHFDRLKELSVEMLLSNGVLRGKLGNPLNIVELIHTTSIGQLNDIKTALAKQIEKIEAKDEWIEPDPANIQYLRDRKELVNLIIGYKRSLMERAENAMKKEELTKKLAELKESTKTPEDRIKEMEAELAAIETSEDFQ